MSRVTNLSPLATPPFCHLHKFSVY